MTSPAPTPPQPPIQVRVTDVDQEVWVRVRDIDMSFGSMVWFMVKWALASIPALIILFAIGWGLMLLFMALVAVVFRG